MGIAWICTTAAEAWQQRTVKPSAGTPNLAVTEERFQTIDGFGGCFNELGWLALQGVDEAARAALLDELFAPDGGCRFTLCRLPIGASDYAAEWYSLNEHAGDFAMEHFSIERDRGCLIPYIREALARQPELRLFASPWSPPTWLKFPRAYNYGTLIWEPAYRAAYARYFVRFVQAYAAAGIPIHQIHPQNEPVADQKFPSCLWTGEQLRDFIRDDLAPAFAAAGLDSEIWLGTLNTDDYDRFVQAVLCDEAAARCIRGVGFQWAGKGAIQRTHDAYPEMKLMQTENECGDGTNSWAYAQYVFGLIRHYLRNGANAYVYWNMVLAPGGLSTWGWRQNAMITADPRTGTLVRNPEFYVMKQLSGHVAPGAQRLGTRGGWSGNALAFENPDGQRVVLVANPLPGAQHLCLAGAAVELPAMSVNTFLLED